MLIILARITKRDRKERLYHHAINDKHTIMFKEHISKWSKTSKRNPQVFCKDYLTLIANDFIACMHVFNIYPFARLFQSLKASDARRSTPQDHNQSANSGAFPLSQPTKLPHNS